MKKGLMKVMRSRITASIIYLLLGLCLALMPVTTVYVLYKVIFGIVMIAVGVYQIFLYLKDSGDATILNMFSGCILVALGIFLFFNPQVVVKLLPFLLGSFVLVDSVWSLQAALRLKKQGISAWIILLVGSLIFVALGIVAIVNPFREVRLTIFFSGVMLLGNGLADLLYLLLIRFWKKPAPKVEESTEVAAVPEKPEEKKEEAPKEEKPKEEKPVPAVKEEPPAPAKTEEEKKAPESQPAPELTLEEKDGSQG